MRSLFSHFRNQTPRLKKKSPAEALVSALSFVILIVITASIQSCTSKSSKDPNFVVIFIDQLSSNYFHCRQDFFSPKSGLQTLCHEASRFSHHFTPSTMTIPNVASAFTGLPLDQSRMRHNGDNLQVNTPYIPQLLHSKLYRTAFLSGGLPVIRPTGLARGFDLFDDFIPATNSPGLLNGLTVFRPSSKIFHLGMNWILENPERPFLLSLYLSDLNFPKEPIFTDSGENKPGGVDNQLDEIDSGLDRLFQTLKSKRLWDKTWIILVGTTGARHLQRVDEIPPLNLHSENTQTILMVKRPLEKNAESSAIQYDANVTTQDIACTIAASLNLSLQFSKQQYCMDLFSPDSQKNTRVIASESAFDQWRNRGQIRYSQRLGSYFVIQDQKLRAFNTLNDPFETTETDDYPEELKTTENFWSSKQSWPDFFYSFINNIPNRSLARVFLYKALSEKNLTLNKLESIAKLNPKDSAAVDILEFSKVLEKPKYKPLGSCTRLIPLLIQKNKNQGAFKGDFEVYKSEMENCDDSITLRYLKRKTDIQYIHKEYTLQSRLFLANLEQYLTWDTDNLSQTQFYWPSLIDLKDLKLGTASSFSR